MNKKFDFSALAESCVKCGKCIPVCTIHSIRADETTSPRGFLELMGAYQDGRLELDYNAKAIFESCFLCTNCVDVCPSRLPVDTAIEHAREEIANKYGIAFYKRAFFWLLRHRTIMDFAAKLGYIFKTCAFSNEGAKSSMRTRFSLPMVKVGRLFPSVAKTSFLNSYPEKIAGDKNRPTVAIFIGCVANYAYTDVGHSLVYILERLGYNVLIPKGQLCCGAPAYFTGDLDTVRTLIAKNADYFSTFIDDVDAILIPEATCSSMIKIDWQHVANDEVFLKAKKFVDKCFIATEWLEKHTELKALLKSEGVRFDELITYHDPCHARKTQGVWREPRALISQNYNMVEMENPNRCCGFGGVTIQTERFKLAQDAGVPKAAMIADTKASIVSAECSACRMQLTEAINAANGKAIFKSPIELIAKALKAQDGKI
jgi:glycolate oxidase iron-sulfur subunit